MGQLQLGAYFGRAQSLYKKEIVFNFLIVWNKCFKIIFKGFKIFIWNVF